MELTRYDDRNEAVLRALLSVFDAEGGWETLPYEDVLRQLQTKLTEALQNTEPVTEAKPEAKPEPPSPEEEQAAHEALSRLDPRPEDRYLGYGEVLRRDLALVDRELFKWTSSLVQPPGPSGEIAVAEFDPAGREG